MKVGYCVKLVFPKLRCRIIEKSIPRIPVEICLIHPPAWPPVSLSFFFCWGWTKLREAGFKKIAGGVRRLGAGDFHRMT